jgi:hypothetical protein
VCCVPIAAKLQQAAGEVAAGIARKERPLDPRH